MDLVALDLPPRTLRVPLLLQIANLLQVDDLERPRERVPPAPHDRETHVLEQIVRMLRPSTRRRKVREKPSRATKTDVRPEREVARVAAVERGGYLGVARAEPRRVALRLGEGVLGRRGQTETERGVPEEVGRDPVGRDFGRVAKIGGDLLGGVRR